MTGGNVLLLALAGFGAGTVNGLAGGGSLISYPVLLATGHSALVSNVTNTVGILPGYAGGALGFKHELAAQRSRIRDFVVAGLAGGIAGAVLLLTTPDRVFDGLAPALIIAACVLFATQPLISSTVKSRRELLTPEEGSGRRAQAAVFLASVYGGYFGAGLGVVLLAALGTALPDPLPKINSLRGILSLGVNGVAVFVFAIGGPVSWGAVSVLAGTSLVGGYVGARTALRIPTSALRALVLVFGALAAARLLTH